MSACKIGADYLCHCVEYLFKTCSSTLISDGGGEGIYVFGVLFAGIWSTPSTTGRHPPPCTWSTFTSIGPHRAVLFGGYLPNAGITSDAVYSFNLKNMVFDSV